MLKISWAIYDLISNEDAYSVSNLGLRHNIHNRPISYLKPEFGVVQAWTGKGYYCNLTDLPRYDLMILAKHFKL